MNELEQVLIGDSAHTPPAIIVEGLGSEAAHAAIAGAPRTIYEELWHIAFWQQVTLDWIRGIETAYPVHASDGFPSADDAEREDWERLRERLFLRRRILTRRVTRSAARRVEFRRRSTMRAGCRVARMREIRMRR